MLKRIIAWIGLFLISSSFVSASCYDIQDSPSEYLKCRTSIRSIFSQWYNALATSNYSDAVLYFERYISENGDTNDQDYNSARFNLYLAYTKLGDSSFYKKDFRLAVNYYLKAIENWNSNFTLQYNLAVSYYNLNEYSNAWLHATNAYNLATEKSDITDSQVLLNDIENKIKQTNAIASAPTNDTYSFAQYYITDLNIHTAWKQVTNPKQVIVAVIDDGISVNHPDLSQNIWISSENVYGSSKIINFQDDNIWDNMTAGEHWTMVAWIIGAVTWNNEWIAWIAKKVKLMPIRIFDMNGNTKEEYIISAINYAIDNWANIINLSLGGSQFKYNKWMDEVIKKAYDRWIFVVIAWWNWDDLSNWKNGVNLDINPIYPVCNNNWKNYSFGVYATEYSWKKVAWSNYWSCTPFFAPWVDIVSTSVPVFNSKYGDNYNIDSWTSFSAPIVSGILALGYNKYGKISYPVAYEALSNATTKNAKGNSVLDANKYLNNLQIYFDKQNSKKLDWLKKKAKAQFTKYQNQYSKLSREQQLLKYKSLLVALEQKNKKLKWDVLKVNIFLIDLVKTQIK